MNFSIAPTLQHEVDSSNKSAHPRLSHPCVVCVKSSYPVSFLSTSGVKFRYTRPPQQMSPRSNARASYSKYGITKGEKSSPLRASVGEIGAHTADAIPATTILLAHVPVLESKLSQPLSSQDEPLAALEVFEKSKCSGNPHPEYHLLAPMSLTSVLRDYSQITSLVQTCSTWTQ